MSMRYKGSVISATPPVLVTDAGASGAWTLEQQMQAKAAGKWPKNGPFNYIEDVFSTYLYTGNGSTQTIVNDIDLANKGGLVWIKNRTGGPYNHMVFDPTRGTSKYLNTNNNFAESTNAFQLTSFNSSGFTLGDGNFTNNSAATYASWTFREQPKFFDVVTWSGDNATERQIAHNLGSTPGMVIIKSRVTDDWVVWHRSLTSGNYIVLNTIDGQTTAGALNRFGNGSTTVDPTSTVFTVGNNGTVNQLGNTYVAYLFAHDAGGFGMSGNDNVISCGTCVSNGSGFIQPVNLGYEPQWVMLKRINSAGGWVMLDTLRGMFNDINAASPVLFANTDAAELGTGTQVNPTATGFQDTIWGGWGASNTYIYVAVRRGPMAVPTLGTKVFNAIARSGTGAAVTVTGAGFTPDWLFTKMRSNIGSSLVVDRLRGIPYLQTPNTSEELANAAIINSTVFSTTMDGFRIPGGSSLNNFASYTYINYLFKRAPKFFDVVCYTGNGSTQTITHNLGVAPELIIAKNRGQAGNNWPALFNFTPTTLGYGFLNTTTAENNQTYAYVGVMSAQPTATNIFLINSSSMNASGFGIVAYLFASCPGVSKVGLYTGTGTTQVINCGFTAGSRFVMIKRADGTGNWYYWDSVRGIVAGDDPYLLMNSTALEVTNTDYIDTSAAGFEITSTAPAEINAVGGSYIFLAVA